MQTTDLKIEEFVGKKHELMRNQMLQDFPVYRTLFAQYAIPEGLNHLYRVDSIKKTIGKAFAAELSIHRTSELRRDLKKLGRDPLPEKGMNGYMGRYGKGYGKPLDHVFVALGGDANEDGKVTGVEITTVLRQYALYVEEIHRHALVESDTNSGRMSSSWTASAWIMCNYPLMPAMETYWAAETITAMLNSIWLCWLFSIDTKYIVVASTFGALESSSGVEHDFVMRVLPDLHDIMTNRDAALKEAKMMNPEFEFDNFFQQGDEESRCRWIDEASAQLITRFPKLLH